LVLSVNTISYQIEREIERKRERERGGDKVCRGTDRRREDRRLLRKKMFIERIETCRGHRRP
jgi:hypothetical protein